MRLRSMQAPHRTHRTFHHIRPNRRPYLRSRQHRDPPCTVHRRRRQILLHMFHKSHRSYLDRRTFRHIAGRIRCIDQMHRTRSQSRSRHRIRRRIRQGRIPCLRSQGHRLHLRIGTRRCSFRPRRTRHSFRRSHRHRRTYQSSPRHIQRIREGSYRLGQRLLYRRSNSCHLRSSRRLSRSRHNSLLWDRCHST